MKKLLLVCLSISSLKTEGQIFNAEDGRSFYGGLNAGANFCEVIGDGYHGYHKVGFHGGAVVYVVSPGRLGGSLEIVYAQKGSRGVREVSSYAGPYFEKYYLDLNYVELPLQLHYFQGRTNVGAGVCYGRLIQAKESVFTDPPYSFDPEAFPFIKQDISFVVSGGYEFWKHWLISGRYQRSISKIRNWYHVPPYFGSGDQYNTHFTMKLIYIF